MAPVALDPVKVQVKQNWADDWVDVPNVEPVSAKLAASSIGSFQFRVRYGSVKFPATTSIATIDHTQLDQQWVRVLSSPYGTGDVLWQGRVELDTRNVYSASSGTQLFTAFDGNQLLRKIEIQKSIYLRSGLDTSQADNLLPFNRHPTSLTKTKNRTGLAAYSGSHIFDPGDLGEFWTVDNAIQYLVSHFLNATDEPVFSIEGSIPHEIEPFSFPIKTNAFDFLNQVVASATGYSFCVLPTTAGFKIKLFSLAVSEVVFGGVTIPANPDSVSIGNATNPEIEIVLEESHSNRFSRVEVVGEPVVFCRSFKVSDGELKQDWIKQGESGSLIPEYLTADDRTSNKYKQLWSRFVVNFEVSKWTQFNNPAVLEDGSIDYGTLGTEGPIPAFSGTLDSLPLRQGNDYLTSFPSPELEGDFSPPLFFVQDSTDRWIEFQSLDVRGDLKALPETIGVQIQSDLPHKFGLGEVIFEETGEPEPVYKSSSAILTIAFQTPQRVKRVSGTSAGETIVINVPDVELWYMSTGTVLGVSDTGEPKIAIGDLTLRDDGDKLDRVMAGAIARYLSPRGKASGTARGLFQWHQDIGSVVTSDDPDIASILTSVQWSFDQQQSTSFQSGFAIQ